MGNSQLQEAAPNYRFQGRGRERPDAGRNTGKLQPGQAGSPADCHGRNGTDKERPQFAASYQNRRINYNKLGGVNRYYFIPS